MAAARSAKGPGRVRALMQARLVRIVGALACLVGLGLVSASSASALPFISCGKGTIVPDMAGSGTVGWMDPAPRPLPAEADPFAPGAKTTIYDQYGYAGLNWNTYDLGCSLKQAFLPGVASEDDVIANYAMGVAHFLGAYSDAVHGLVAAPGGLVTPLQNVTAPVQARVRQAVMDPYGGLALLGVTVLVAVAVLMGRLSQAMKLAAVAVVVYGLGLAFVNVPVESARVADSTIEQLDGAIGARLAGQDPGSASGFALARKQNAMVVDQFYLVWLRGEFGSSDSATAVKYGPALFKAGALDYHEAAIVRAGGPAAKKIVAQHEAAFDTVAAQIHDADPIAYSYVQGASSGARSRPALLGWVITVAMVAFRGIADTIVLLALVAVVVALCFLPAFVVLAMIPQTRQYAIHYAQMFVAALMNSAMFTIGAGVFALVFSGLEGTSASGWAVVLLLFIVGAGLWAFLKPFRSVLDMVPGSRALGDPFAPVGRGAGKLGSLLASYIGAEAGGKAGAKQGSGNGGERADSGAAAAGSATEREREPDIVEGEIIEDERAAVTSGGSRGEVGSRQPEEAVGSAGSGAVATRRSAGGPSTGRRDVRVAPRVNESYIVYDPSNPEGGEMTVVNDDDVIPTTRRDDGVFVPPPSTRSVSVDSGGEAVVSDDEGGGR